MLQGWALLPPLSPSADQRDDVPCPLRAGHTIIFRQDTPLDYRGRRRNAPAVPVSILWNIPLREPERSRTDATHPLALRSAVPRGAAGARSASGRGRVRRWTTRPSNRILRVELFREKCQAIRRRPVYPTMKLWKFSTTSDLSVERGDTWLSGEAVLGTWPM